MKKLHLRKTLCIVAAIGLAFGVTACGENNTPTLPVNKVPVTTEALSENNSIDEYSEINDLGENSTDDVSVSGADEFNDSSASGADAINDSSESGESKASEKVDIKKPDVNRAYEGSVADRYPDASAITQIGEGRFIVLFRDKTNKTTEVLVYDINSDKELNRFTVNNLNAYVLEPIVYMDKGFGFITDYRTDNKGDGAYGYYYDIEGNLINKFNAEFNEITYYSFTLAPDGSAMYAVVSDRLQCACGFDFKADYTTKIYAEYPDGTEKLIKEFDSHYSLGLMGVSSDGKLAFAYSYNPNDLEIKTHEEYEMGFGKAVSIEDLEAGLESTDKETSDEKQGERGYAIFDPNGNDTELQPIYQTNKYYEHTFFKGDAFILTSDDEIVYLYPDGTGNYKSSNIETTLGLKGYYTDVYVSSSGDYIVYPVYTEEFMDTTIVAMKFEGDKIIKVFEKKFDGWKIDFPENYNINYLDEETGDMYANYTDNVNEGNNNRLFSYNIFDD